MRAPWSCRRSEESPRTVAVDARRRAPSGWRAGAGRPPRCSLRPACLTPAARVLPPQRVPCAGALPPSRAVGPRPPSTPAGGVLPRLRQRAPGLLQGPRAVRPILQGQPRPRRPSRPRRRARGPTAKLSVPLASRVVRPVSARSAGPIATEPRAGVQRLAASQILSRTACRSWTLWPFRICAGRPGDAPPHPDICAGSSDGDSYRGRAACRIVDRERGFEQGRQGPGSQPEQGPLVVFGPPLRRSHPSRCCGPGPALTAIGRRRVGTAGRVVGVGAYAAAGSR